MSFKRHLSYARGYLELGMLAEAELELTRIRPPHDRTPDCMSLRLMLLQEKQDWQTLAVFAAECAQHMPDDPGVWVTWAYAARRAHSLIQAERILLEAETHHPSEPTIQFNLGCYACLRGDLADAKRRVDRAITLDPKFGPAAATDPDLAALRAVSGEEQRKTN